MAKWKYKIDSHRTNQIFDGYLNDMGGQGWELVSVEDMPGGYWMFIWKAPASLYSSGETFMAGVKT